MIEHSTLLFKYIQAYVNFGDRKDKIRSYLSITSSSIHNEYFLQTKTFIYCPCTAGLQVSKECRHCFLLRNNEDYIISHESFHPVPFIAFGSRNHPE